MSILETIPEHSPVRPIFEALGFVNAAAEALLRYTPADRVPRKVDAWFVLSVCAFAQETGDEDVPEVLADIAVAAIERASSKSFRPLRSQSVPNLLYFQPQHWDTLRRLAYGQIHDTAGAKVEHSYLEMLKGSNQSEIRLVS